MVSKIARKFNNGHSCTTFPDLPVDHVDFVILQIKVSKWLRVYELLLSWEHLTGGKGRGGGGVGGGSLKTSLFSERNGIGDTTIIVN